MCSLKDTTAARKKRIRIFFGYTLYQLCSPVTLGFQHCRYRLFRQVWNNFPLNSVHTISTHWTPTVPKHEFLRALSTHAKKSPSAAAPTVKSPKPRLLFVAADTVAQGNGLVREDLEVNFASFHIAVLI